MHDNPDNFNKLNIEKQTKLLNWISENLTPIKSFNEDRTSYGLKHIFEAAPGGFYTDNGEFKGAMLKAGFNVMDVNMQNWYFNISKKSKCLKK